MMRSLVPFVLVVVASACTDPQTQPDNGGETAESGDRRYLRLNDEFDDESQCPSDGLPNCHAILELCENGAMTIMLTDIVDEGTYVRDDKQITGTLNQPGGPWVIDATIEEDGTIESDDIGGRHPFVPVVLDEAGKLRLADTCANVAMRPWF
jgi:hypothetical protein